MRCRRYYEGITVSGILSISFLFGGVYAFVKKDKDLYYGMLVISAILFLAAIIIALKLPKAPGRLLSSERDDIKIKPEEGCFEDWDGEAPVDIDGVCIEGKKFKVMNGVDVKVTKNGEIKYCSALAGFLNKIRQKEEREAIESSDCWKC